MKEEKLESSKNSILKDFIPQLKSFVQSETVFGEPYKMGEISVIPVNSVKVGFGFGNGTITKTNGGGGGGGVLLTPVAFLVVKGDQITVHSLNAGVIENVMEKIPDFLDKIVTTIQKGTNKAADESSQTSE